MFVVCLFVGWLVGRFVDLQLFFFLCLFVCWLFGLLVGLFAFLFVWCVLQCTCIQAVDFCQHSPKNKCVDSTWRRAIDMVPAGGIYLMFTAEVEDQHGFIPFVL